ncbi:MAG: methyl-accepting chemotaxis protein [Desulfococcaceae bacterium]|jgi:methyl-accepting chemotaxis protein|nr:methyl-accepting chemotaxis protein [Desulfococcaceae bacterium]
MNKPGGIIRKREQGKGVRQIMHRRIPNMGKILQTEKIRPFISRLGMKIPFLHRFFSPTYRIRQDLHSLIPSLEGVMEKAEPDFLRIGRELQSMYKDAGHLTERMTAAAGNIGCGEGCDSFLSNIDRIAKHSLADLQGYRHKISSSMNNVSQSLEHLGRLCRICSVIEKTGMSLNVIGLNIAVESSRSAESGEMFSVFTEEIRQLSLKISSISQSILEDAGRTRSGQITANADILKSLETFGHLYSNAQRLVQKAIREIYSIMDMSMKVLEISNAHSQEISRQVGEVVVALQFHDIARQKIEHIVMALRDLEASAKEKTKEDSEEASQQFCRLLLLQHGQLKEVITEIRRAYEKSHLAFRELGGQLDQLISDIAVFETDRREESRIRKRISALKSGLEQLGELLDQGRELENQIKNTAEEVGQTASQLSEHIDRVRGISMDLHLKALNAVVKSARLAEEGQVLEILAQEVSSLSRQSDNFVSDVVAILEELVSFSLKLNPDSFEEGGRGSSAVSELSVEDGVRELTENYGQFKDNTSAAIQKARRLRSAMLSTGGTLGFLTELAEELDNHLLLLENLIDRQESRTEKKEHSWNTERDPNTAAAARRYTMKSERQLHRQYLGNGADMLLSGHAEDSEDIFEDFSEMTDAEEPEKKTAENTEKEKDSRKQKTEKKAADTSALHTKESNGKSAAEIPAENPYKDNDENEDLGDNVELF